MNFKTWLNEMPITNWQLLGNWDKTPKRQYGYDPSDVNILTQHQEKIHKKWSNSKENFDFYFIRAPKVHKFIEVGAVTPEWVKTNLGIDIRPNADAITVIFTNNRGDQKIPMTAWLIAHRFGHSIRQIKEWKEHFEKELIRDFHEILSSVYGMERKPDYADGGYKSNNDALKALANAVGTMQSVRSNNLRNFPEFLHEILAQYLITGQIKFNPLPVSLMTQRRFAWGNPAHNYRGSKVNEDERKEWSEILQGHAQKYEYNLDSILNGLTGKIFVM